MNELIQDIEAGITSVAPVVGVVFGSLSDKATWVIQFEDGVTTQQRARAQAVIAGYDLAKGQTKADAMRRLKETDRHMARAVEDIIDNVPGLISRLPKATQDKISQRKTLRAQVNA